MGGSITNLVQEFNEKDSEAQKEREKEKQRILKEKLEHELLIK